MEHLSCAVAQRRHTFGVRRRRGGGLLRRRRGHCRRGHLAWRSRQPHPDGRRRCCSLETRTSASLIRLHQSVFKYERTCSGVVLRTSVASLSKGSLYGHASAWLQAAQEDMSRGCALWQPHPCRACRCCRGWPPRRRPRPPAGGLPSAPTPLGPQHLQDRTQHNFTDRRSEVALTTSRNETSR